MHGRNWLAVPLFAFLTAPCAHAQQNWCSNPRTPDEITICGNSELSQFDRQLGQLYIAVRTGLSLDQQSLLRDTQRAWLSQRSACGWNADCIARLYQTRIPQLRGMLAGGAPLPSTGSAPADWCSNPRTPDEITICGNSALSQFDRQLGQLYIAVRTGLSLDQQSLLRDTQRAWLSQRSACGWNADCIARLYQTRIPQLRGMLAGGAPLPSTGSAPAATPAPVPTPTGSGRDACDMFPTLCPPG